MIVSKVLAQNDVDWSDESSLSSPSADVRVAPHKPPTPPARDSASSHLSLIVNLPPLNNPDNGGSPITSYHLQYDDASSGSIWTDI